MVSKSTDSASNKSKKLNGGGGQTSDMLGTLSIRINQLKKQIQAERAASVKDKVEDNKTNLETHVSKLIELASSRQDVSISNQQALGDMLLARIENPLCKFNGLAQGWERDSFNAEEALSSTTAKLPLMENIPPYTTWIFLDKNQRMAEDQSVVGRRRIYYDPHGSEALICSDSEEEMVAPEEEKHEFSEAEDRILWMTFTEYGLDEEVLKILIQFVGGTTSEIQERCNMLNEENQARLNKNLLGSEKTESEESAFLGKRLSAALDSFDNLFCRRCLVFDCRLHGCSQILINSSEKQSYSSDSEDERRPCSENCCLQLRVVENLPQGMEGSSFHVCESKTSAEDGGTLLGQHASETGCMLKIEHNHETPGKRKVLEPLNTVVELASDNLLGSSSKKLKSAAQGTVSMAVDESVLLDQNLSVISKDQEFSGADENQTINDASKNFGCLTNNSGDKVGQDERSEVHEMCILEQTSNLKNISDWKPLEKELFFKGIEIFGRNSCLIARNLLPGLKTCVEVSSFMNDAGEATSHGTAAFPNTVSADNGRGDIDHMVEAEMPARSRLFRKRGRTRKLKYSWKSAGHPSIWRRIVDDKNQSCKQYTPCGCQPICGKQCPCLQNGTCCEKYCGCSKSCKNRFRGCHCAKSQCRSRQCPCFAAGRECDPDVCRNCWVSCGDGSLGEPPRQGDGQCGNMRLLLRQQQRILLAKSDVAGWGAFLKNPVNKNDYLGEYTGELISHREADKRGKIYDRANSSFLFDLNDQYVLDAYRKGDKLKFANHSANPNCYAKVTIELASLLISTLELARSYSMITVMVLIKHLYGLANRRVQKETIHQYLKDEQRNTNPTERLGSSCCMLVYKYFMCFCA
nr:histone-lysine N-methyltransferase EZA1-like isoform X1 [Coffea arabica]